MRLYCHSAFLLLVCVCCVSAQPLVSPFAGSESLGEYSVDFVHLDIAHSVGGEIETITVEGRLTSHLYRKPKDKSNLELFRSYQNELAGAGFDNLLAYSENRRLVQRLVRSLYGLKGNALSQRPYTLEGTKTREMDKNQVVAFAEYYLAARKVQSGSTFHVILLVGRDGGLYAVDVLESQAMETGTVTISPETLRSKIDAEGKVDIYDIHFDTDSAHIRAESRPALEVIAAYVEQAAGRTFYVVGHTDDTGSMAHNLELSESRAEAVVEALSSQYGIDAARLKPRGVGPFAPLASNQTDPGRSLNRRVVLVLRLDN